MAYASSITLIIFKNISSSIV